MYWRRRNDGKMLLSAIKLNPGAIDKKKSIIPGKVLETLNCVAHEDLASSH